MTIESRFVDATNLSPRAIQILSHYDALESIFMRLFRALRSCHLYMINPFTGEKKSYSEVINEIYPNPFEDALSAELAWVISQLIRYGSRVGHTAEDIWDTVVSDAAAEYIKDPGIPFYNDQKREDLILHHIKKAGRLFSARVESSNNEFDDSELEDIGFLYPDWMVKD